MRLALSKILVASGLRIYSLAEKPVSILCMNDRRLLIFSRSLALGICLTFTQPLESNAAEGALKGFEDLFPDETLATGMNLKVTRNELDQSYIYIKANKASQGVVIREAQRQELESQLLDKLITTKLIIARATKAETKQGEDFRQQQLQLLRDRLGSEEAAQRHIIASGVTEDYFRQQLFEEGVVKAVIQREIKGAYVVPPSKIQSTYQENQNAFTQPQSIRIQRIFIGRISPGSGTMLPEKSLIEKRTLMEDIRRRALAGEDFGKLANEFSEDPLTRQRGGEVVVAKGQTKPEFEIPAFQLQPGNISNIMTIGAGFHLIKMLEHRPAKLRPLQEVEEAIRLNLEAQYIEEKLPAYLVDLKKEAGVRIVSQP